jgi:hypothetical protein
MAMRFMACGSFQKFFAEDRSRAAAIVCVEQHYCSR